MPAKDLDPEQKADAARLKAAWEAWKADQRASGAPFSQEHIAHELGFKTQSAVSQYIGGGIPLNPDALKKFCELFGVTPVSVSPGIVAQMQAQAREWLLVAKGKFVPPQISVKTAKKAARNRKR